MKKYIFVVGGVISGVGKGVTTASICKILQEKCFSVTAIKIDPYVNVDAGTMNPTEHGEVFVLDDGLECDQDMGNYERYLETNLTSANYMTTGSVYLSLINQERSLKFAGKCVEVVPHVPLEVISRIKTAGKKAQADIVLIEVGGTVGEYQNLLFLEAIRMLKLQKPQDVALLLVSFLPQQTSEAELKTKPTQYAVRSLNYAGLQPDIIIARAEVPLDDKRKEKIAFNCSVTQEAVISAPNVKNIYDIPHTLESENLSTILFKKLNLKNQPKTKKKWSQKLSQINKIKKNVEIGIVGKYFQTGNFVLSDSYISVIEAVKHAAYQHNHNANITWLNAGDFEPEFHSPAQIKKNLANLKKYQGIIIPGGFGSRGTEGKINVIQYLRENNLPFLGLCFGLQLALIEYARHVSGLKNANSTEINPKTPHPVIDILKSQRETVAKHNFGGTMRLGAYLATLEPNSKIFKLYQKSHRLQKDQIQINNLLSDSTQQFRIGQNQNPKNSIIERHRHRYEVSPNYLNKIFDQQLTISGYHIKKDLTKLVEFIELKNHPYFIATQSHPEFKSNLFDPAPTFLGLIEAAIKNI
ncbi:MAG: CTP synthase [Patescibacteria group bacterium]